MKIPAPTEVRAVALVAIVLAALRLPYLFSAGVQFDNDSAVYFSLVPAFLGGTPPDLFGPALPVEADLIYPPGYPALLAAAALVPAVPWSFAVVGLQQLMAISAACLVWWLGRREGFAVPGLLAALLSGATAESLFYGQLLYSETLFVFVFTVYLAALLRATDEARPASTRFVSAGLLLGAAIAVRPIALLFIPLSVVHVAIGSFPRWNPSVKERRRAALATTAGAAAVLLAITIYHGVCFSVWGLTTYWGGHLFNRVVGGCGLVDGRGEHTRRIAAVGNRDVTGYTWEWLLELRRSGLGVEQADQLLGAAAAEGIKANPIGYVGCVLAESLRVARTIGYPFPEGGALLSPAAYQTRLKEWVHYPPAPQERVQRETFVRRVELVAPGALLPAAIGQSIQRFAWQFVPSGREAPFVLGYLCAFGFLWWRRPRSRRAFWAGCLVAYPLGSVAIEWSNTRYFFPTIPMALLLLFSVCAEAVRNAAAARVSTAASRTKGSTHPPTAP